MHSCKSCCSNACTPVLVVLGLMDPVGLLVSQSSQTGKLQFQEETLSLKNEAEIGGMAQLVKVDKGTCWATLTT